LSTPKEHYLNLRKETLHATHVALSRDPPPLRGRGPGKGDDVRKRAPPPAEHGRSAGSNRRSPHYGVSRKDPTTPEKPCLRLIGSEPPLEKPHEPVGLQRPLVAQTRSNTHLSISPHQTNFFVYPAGPSLGRTRVVFDLVYPMLIVFKGH